MDTRERILQAAARVYAQHGFRGATTRLIAIEAGVNEVSLFRTFGSKAALFEAMMQSHAASLPVPTLPDVPGDAQSELTAWCAALLAHMRQWRSIIRKSFGELEERPEAATVMCEGPNCAATALAAYATRLQTEGLADETADIPTAVSMFISSMFGDAISRDVLPHAFPQPEEDAPAKYVSVFLRAVGALGAGDAAPPRIMDDANDHRVTA
ncbi:MAG TPA: helix-turn-helix domain-containing protein [Gemmatimonadaceae bacterium]|nr:helix-turn-helix domain-containing protein [Gemmatimonadaceae bacterium]